MFSSVAKFVKDNWGSVASVLGFLLSIWVLITTKKVKQIAKRIQALEGKKALADEVTEARAIILQLGAVLRQQNWDAVNFRLDEAISRCNTAMAHWGANLPKDGKEDLQSALVVLDTILKVTCKASIKPLTNGQNNQVLDAQVTANMLISRVLGHARKTLERSR